MLQQKISLDLSGQYIPNDRQYLFHAAPELYKLYGGAMGGGKTAALINEAITLSFEYNGNFGLLLRKTAPSFNNTVLPQLEKFIKPALVHKWNQTKRIITFINGSRLLYGGLGDREDDWEKFMSGEYGFIALDQAEDFNEDEYTKLATRLRLNIPGIRYYFLLSCNPSPGWIKTRFIQRKYKDHVFIPALPEDNVKNLPRGYIQRMRSILDPIARAALLEGNWDVVGKPDNVYSYDAINAASSRTEERKQPVCLGVDCARFGDDLSVIALQEGLKVTIPFVTQGIDTMEFSGEILDLVKSNFIFWRDELGATEIRIKIDADGLGAGVFDRVKEIVYEIEDELNALKNSDGEKPRVEIFVSEIRGSAKASEPLDFKNLRAEVHWALRELLDVLDLPDDDDLFSELMAIRYRINSAGQKEILPKDEIKKILGRSPDRAEAVIYAVADVGDDYGFIEV